MNIEQLDVWIIDNESPTRDNPLVDKIASGIFNAAIDSSNLGIPDVVSYSLDSILQIAPEFSNEITQLPAVVFIDERRNFGLKKFQGNFTAQEVIDSYREVGTYTFNDESNGYFNSFGFPKPILLFRDPSTGIVDIFKQSLFSFSKSTWGIIAALTTVGAITSNNPLKKGICAITALVAANQFIK